MCFYNVGKLENRKIVCGEYFVMYVSIKSLWCNLKLIRSCMPTKKTNKSDVESAIEKFTL